MNELDFEGLQPEIFFAQDWFSDFTEAYAKVLNDNIRWPAYQLETIRNITNETDPYVIKQTLHQLGFNLPYDFIEHNYPVLSASVQQLALYSERSGTKDYAKLISFVLGRSIDTTSLYTNNYQDFYPKPYGPLQVEGGDWYKTTHIELGMQSLGSDSRLAIPRGKTLKDRFLDAFYEFAPWSIVVDSFHFNVDVRANLSLSGVVFKQPTRYINVGDSAFVLKRIRLELPAEVSELSEHAFRVLGEYSDDTGDQDDRIVEMRGVSFSSNRSGLVTFKDNTIAFGSVARDTEVMIYASIDGVSAGQSIKVVNDLDRIHYLEIVGADRVVAGESSAYHVVAHTDGGPEPTDVQVRTISPHATAHLNELTVHRLVEDTTIDLTAELRTAHGLIRASKQVQGVYKDFDLHVTHLEIVAPSVVDEDAVVQVECKAHYSDGSTSNVLADWRSTSNAIHVTPEGRLSAGKTESTINITLTALHQYKGVVYSAEHQIELRHRELSITGLEIVGNHQVIANESYRYAVVATFSDGTRGYVEASWTATRFRVSEDGVLHVGYVGADPVYLTLKASVEGVTAIKDVTAIDTPIVLLNIHVTGPDNVREGSGGQYRAFARYSNGRDVEIQPQWSIKDNPRWASIDTNGVLSFSDPKMGIIEIQALYRFGERVFEQGRPVVAIPNTRIIQGLLISGPEVVYEHERVLLSATAVYSDGTVEVVSPMWEVQSADPLNIPEVAADIVSPGLLQGREVDEETEVIAIARYFKEVQEFRLIIKPRPEQSPDVPVSSRIIGPAAFNANAQGSYAQAIVFEACRDELLVSSDWSIDTDPSVAIITSSGFVRSINGRSTTATITATYDCGGRVVVDSMVINIIGLEDQLESLEIIGPSAVLGETFTTYVASLKRKNIDEKEQVQASWSIIPQDGRVAVNAEGQIYVLDSSETFSFVLRAEYAEEFEKISATKEVTVLRDAKPVYGIGPVGIRTHEQVVQYLTNELTDERVQQFTLNAQNMGEYMYVCYPVALGLARFIDTATDFDGGWDGATWPDDDIGTIFGPLTIQRTIHGATSEWYLYRTDFDGIGLFTYEITFGVQANEA